VLLAVYVAASTLLFVIVPLLASVFDPLFHTDTIGDKIAALGVFVGLCTITLVVGQIVIALLELRLVRNQDKIMNAQHAELMRKPELRLIFSDGQTEFIAQRFVDNDPDPELEYKTTHFHRKATVRFYMLNVGQIAVPSAYARIWLPPNWSAEPYQDEQASFVYAHKNVVDGQKRRAFDLYFSTPIYPGVEIKGPAVMVSAPKDAYGDALYRVFTDRFTFPAEGHGRLTLAMPESEQSIKARSTRKRLFE
jgi:hypothetical protein